MGHLTSKVNALAAKDDPAKMAEAGGDRIFEISQAISTLAGARPLERIEHDEGQMKTTELTKLHKSSTDLVTLKQQWSQGSRPAPTESGVSVLAALLEQADPTISRRDVIPGSAAARPI